MIKKVSLIIGELTTEPYTNGACEWNGINETDDIESALFLGVILNS